MNYNNTNIVWFKRDLRVADHEPLFEACIKGKVIPLYIIEPDYWKLADTSRSHWCFINDSLHELNQELEKLGGKLIVKVGDAAKIFYEFYAKLGNFTLWSHEETGNNFTYQRDKKILSFCRENSIKWHEFESNGVVRRLKNRDFWSVTRNKRMLKVITPSPVSISHVENVFSENIPPKNDPLFGDATTINVQKGGRKEAEKMLFSFLDERCFKYLQTISKPGYSARHSSRLSAHISYGTISIREIEKSAMAMIDMLSTSLESSSLAKIKNISAFLSRIAWHCHFIQKLEQQPEIEFKCMHPAFEGLRESNHNEEYFTAWKTGNTGYPLIDACMRSLHQNGWINFRMRAMLVSFASYHLWLDWRKTGPFLAKLFVDYEPGIHYSQLQMQSGVTGINTIRIYNPIKQSIDHDNEGKFIRRYVPELSLVPKDWIHEPWMIPPLVNMDIDQKNYPRPIVNNQDAIKIAKNKLTMIFKQPYFKDHAQVVNKKLGSRKTSKQKTKIVTNSQLEFKFD